VPSADRDVRVFEVVVIPVKDCNGLVQLEDAEIFTE